MALAGDGFFYSILLHPVGVSSVFHLGGRPLGKATFWEPLVGFTPQLSLPSWSSSPQYTLPGISAQNIERLNVRLEVIESTSSALVLENEQKRMKTANGEQGRVELIGRMRQLEGMVKQESGRWLVSSSRARFPLPRSVSSDKEVRAKLAAFEEPLGSVDGGAKEALDVGKSALTKASESTTSNKGLTIKSSDGTDITSLITQVGVALAIPMFVEDITIDRVPREVAYGIMTVPWQMEMWRMVEGKENVAKVRG
ncbi:hypothetical protein BDP27DRAFT_1369367 [Rhodocollybia butyracea]|uniref:Uncharacterized protein n=1 Tax=Rhodocollybia butyracea TaxID=206335 RepID=A0A9P5PEF7_9AGAR|nr:hypothetical protein BDP27DRAFT_1369367 [Rhodocollybia butyracea]